jgi:hypothetical protein
MSDGVGLRDEGANSRVRDKAVGAVTADRNGGGRYRPDCLLCRLAGGGGGGGEPAEPL